MTKAYCQMTSLVGCAGGGWTMVMKVDGRQVILCRFAEIFGGRREGGGGQKPLKNLGALLRVRRLQAIAKWFEQ